MLERFLKQTRFTSEEDYREHLQFIIPEDFNFAYDVMDEWAKLKPYKVALLWTNEDGEEGDSFHVQGHEGADRPSGCLLYEPRHRAR